MPVSWSYPRPFGPYFLWKKTFTSFLVFLSFLLAFLSRFCPDFIPISSRFGPDFVPIWSRFGHDFVPISSLNVVICFLGAFEQLSMFILVIFVSFINDSKFLHISSWFLSRFSSRFLSRFSSRFLSRFSSWFRFWQSYFIKSFEGGLQCEFIRTFLNCADFGSNNFHSAKRKIRKMSILFPLHSQNKILSPWYDM